MASNRQQFQVNVFPLYLNQKENNPLQSGPGAESKADLLQAKYLHPAK